MTQDAESDIQTRAGLRGDILEGELERLWRQVPWRASRARADEARRDAIQACHALHRAETPAYRERCEREGIGDSLPFDRLASVAFPETIYKAYADRRTANGERLGVFCERDVPLLLSHLNRYVSQPISMDGLSDSYLSLTNIRGGLDRFRRELERAQGVRLLTSSGTTGAAVSLIPSNRAATVQFERAMVRLIDELTDVPGYGPIDPDRGCIVGYVPRKGSMLMAVGFETVARRFGDRAFFAIDSRIETRELRWYGGGVARPGAPVERVLMGLAQRAIRPRMSQRSAEAFVTSLGRAAGFGMRTLVIFNAWMAYPALLRMQAMLDAEVTRGAKAPGDPLIRLAPGSVLATAGGNKSGLPVPGEEIIGRFLSLVGGIDKVADAWGQGESMSGAIRCEQGHYHGDSHIEYFTVGSYLAYFDPRQIYRIPAIVTGDLVDRVHDEPCPCGSPIRYFTRVARDERLESKGCAAALAEYA